MDCTTVQHYDAHAEAFAARYQAADASHLQQMFRRWLRSGERVLEIGCGCGRDASFIASLGCQLTATDASEGMLDQVPSEYRKAASFRCASFPLPAGDPLLKQRFDAVVAVAVLMHVPDHELFEFAYQIRTLLKENGIFICSLSPKRQKASDDPRLYADRQPQEVQLLFERLGFRLVDIETTPDGLGRDMVWRTLILSSAGTVAIRPLDQIESIITRDRNTATYKLALLRALCEIAQTSFRQVRWHEGDQVSVPLGLIVEKWLYYYWPVVDAPFELPEMRVGTRAKGLAFRPALEQLISSCEPGGLDTFYSLFRNGRLNQEQTAALNAAAGTIARAIVEGPVTYSGGSIEGVEQVFRYEPGQRTRHVHTPLELAGGFGRVYMPASLWREMCLVGHWIAEAIVLRWARLSHIFSKAEVAVSEVIARLLVSPESERNVDFAKAIYSALPELRCVWTGRQLDHASFDIDHAIPFSLWPNNHLWNLLPTHPRVNNLKRERIVTHSTLISSRDRIIDYWQAGQQASPNRFIAEIGEALVGDSLPVSNWETQAFSALVEAAEVIAVQRGARRWHAAAS